MNVPLAGHQLPNVDDAVKTERILDKGFTLRNFGCTDKQDPDGEAGLFVIDGGLVAFDDAFVFHPRNPLADGAGRNADALADRGICILTGIFL